jgi:hypothetical protein
MYLPFPQTKVASLQAPLVTAKQRFRVFPTPYAAKKCLNWLTPIDEYEIVTLKVTIGEPI